MEKLKKIIKGIDLKGLSYLFIGAIIASEFNFHNTAAVMVGGLIGFLIVSISGVLIFEED